MDRQQIIHIAKLIKKNQFIVFFMQKKIVLTGDRPTGPLHLGHLLGSLKNRVELQKSCKVYILVADAQALTDNQYNTQKIRENIIHVIADYLAVGINPDLSCILLQSCIPGLSELAMYYMNLVTIQQLGHNPTVKMECKMRGFHNSVAAGFYLYPIYQAADITAFNANLVPVGIDQAPMIELTREVVSRFNQAYPDQAYPEGILVKPEPLYSSTEIFPGIDGKKMSKSLKNSIFLSDSPEIVAIKVRKMKSDESRLSAMDPGDPDRALAFLYLDKFCKDQDWVEHMKKKYRAGQVSDKSVKDDLIQILEEFLAPIREKRQQLMKDRQFLWKILKEGTMEANNVVQKTLERVKKAMGIFYLS